MSNELTLIYIASFLISGLIYGILGIRQAKIYNTEKIRASLWYTVFFFSLFGFNEFAFLYYLIGSDIETTVFLIATIMAISFLFVSATSMIAREEIGYLVLGFGIILTLGFSFFYFIAGMDNPLFTILRIVVLLYNVVLAIVAIVFFLYLTREFKSGKSLGFALGLVCLTIGGFIQRFTFDYIYDLSGIIYILGAVFMALGFFNILDTIFFPKAD